MFRWPGTIQPADRPELCSSIDFVPTILAAAGATAPHDFPGLNLLPELKSGRAIERDALFGESFAHDIADIQNPQASLLYRWVIRGHDKLLLTYDGAPGKMKYPPQSAEPQLFDLKNDPREEKNLAADNPELVNELSSLLDKWYVPSERQAGKFAPVAPKRKKQ
ncbi:MAG: hypothetical protein ISQ06_03390 [Planctomycetaceae bacterium]|jgi:arylsulfatase A-like enzyme|nr:hypothetical protein [Planctomycetaceae bacterium]